MKLRGLFPKVRTRVRKQFWEIYSKTEQCIVPLFNANTCLFLPVFSLIPVSVFSPAIRKATQKMSLLWSLQIDLLVDPASKTKGLNLFSGVQLHLLQCLNQFMAFHMAWSSKELLWRINLFKLCSHGQCSWFYWRSRCHLFGAIRRFLQESYQLVLALPLWQQNKVKLSALNKESDFTGNQTIIFFLQVFEDCTWLWSPGQNNLKML